MTQTFLLEIGLEELPAQYVRSSMESLKHAMAAFLEENHLNYQELESFATPRRLAVRVQGLDSHQANQTLVHRGPSLAIAQKDGQWTKAAQGFAKGKGGDLEDLYVQEDNGQAYVYLKQEIQGRPLDQVLSNLGQVIAGLKFPVAMRWASHSFEYLRPIHWLVALLDDQVLDQVSVLDIHAGRQTRGHRFLGQTIDLPHAKDYEALLKEQFVLVDMDQRKSLIRQQILALGQAQGWTIPIDEDLLEEVTCILEYPTAFYGNFDEKYLQVPSPVLVTSMREHQRYFVVYDQAGNLLPHFVSVRNGDDRSLETVAKGNQKVLTARLEDALFFYLEDQKLSLDTCLAKLDSLNFHAKIGSMTQKMQRSRAWVQILGDQLGLDQEVMAHSLRAGQIYKFDLVTNMVGEFPELQGIMGNLYAQAKGEAPEVALAIEEHYMPIAADAALPASPAGALLALADKLDSFLSFMAIGQYPTGSNDPYALRRQAMGIVQILIDQAWSLDLQSLIQTHMPSLYAGILSQDLSDVLSFSRNFFQDRMTQYLSQNLANATYDQVDAVVASSQVSYTAQVQTAKWLSDLSRTEGYKTLIESFNRVLNLATKAPAGQVDPALFETSSEQALYQASQALDLDYGPDWDKKLQALPSLEEKISAFFSENMVMVEDLAIQANRLSLLAGLGQKLVTVADFTRLKTK